MFGHTSPSHLHQEMVTLGSRAFVRASTQQAKLSRWVLQSPNRNAKNCVVRMPSVLRSLMLRRWVLPTATCCSPVANTLMSPVFPATTTVQVSLQRDQPHNTNTPSWMPIEDAQLDLTKLLRTTTAKANRNSAKQHKMRAALDGFLRALNVYRDVRSAA